ncbi:hypothetical protein F373_gp015 [Bacillus phage SP-10]|uniref:hypothetical protein n=1 Tax=Bacillus phage SP10 TaxID=941058 RepID=UPI0002198AE3|nr:hypothetical protein F373_gp015 [Bacillus phage SP-10]BAK52827.1 hypothetical protein [Bacillus phage SP-10]
MEELTMFEVKIDNPTERLDDALLQEGFTHKGKLYYDYPVVSHGETLLKRVSAPVYEKDDKLYYVSSITGMDYGLISAVKLGKASNKKYRNPIFVDSSYEGELSKDLDMFLSLDDHELLHKFKWGTQGAKEFNKFMRLVRKLKEGQYDQDN